MPRACGVGLATLLALGCCAGAAGQGLPSLPIDNTASSAATARLPRTAPMSQAASAQANSAPTSIARTTHPTAPPESAAAPSISAQAVRPASHQEIIPRTGENQPVKLSPRSRGAGSQPADGSPRTSQEFASLTTVCGSLAVAIGAFLVAAWCMRRFAPRGLVGLPHEAIEVLGRTTLAPRQTVQLVRCGNKLLLLASRPAGLELLTEIDDPQEVARLSDLCQASHPGDSESVLRRLLVPKVFRQEPTSDSFAGSPWGDRHA